MSILELLYPPKCASCGELIDSARRRVRESGGDALCPDCRAEWERGKLEKCDFCGRAMMDCICVPRTLYDAGCKSLIKLCQYGGENRRVATSVIFCLKKQYYGKCERFAANQLSYPIKKFLLENPDKSFCFTNIPRRKNGIINYGYDHARILAKSLSRLLGVPYFEIIKRKRDGSEQKDLDFFGRQSNVRGAFRLAKGAEKLPFKNIILIDDVVTTGASSAECLRLLKDGGFDSVTVACIARSMRKRKNDKI